MNRWVLLEHTVYKGNLKDIHYDFLVEAASDCLTWKLSEIPLSNSGLIEIHKQPNHRLIWLARLEFELSDNRGSVKRIDNGIFINLPLRSDSQDLLLILDGSVLNGLFEISGNLCKLTKNN